MFHNQILVDLLFFYPLNQTCVLYLTVAGLDFTKSGTDVNYRYLVKMQILSVTNEKNRGEWAASKHDLIYNLTDNAA